jgi:FkbM family methyltransferase
MSKNNPSSGRISGQVNIFVKCFELMQRAKLIEHPLCQEAFRRFYFVYKRYLDDPFHSLTTRYPAMFHNGHILDIGANVGYTACTFAKCISPGFKVFAFEPEQNSFDLLLTSICSKRLEGVVYPTRSAVGDLNGMVDIWRNIYHSADHRTVTNEFMKLLGTSDCEVQSVPIVVTCNEIPLGLNKTILPAFSFFSE